MGKQIGKRKGSVRRQIPKSRRYRPRRPIPWRWILAGTAAVAVVVLAIVMLPRLFRKKEQPELKPGSVIDSAMTAATANAVDLSALQQEAKIQYNAINEPYKFGNEIVFSATSGSVSYTKLVLYQTDTASSDTIPVKVKYNNLTGMVMNEKYIVYLDSSSGGGGRICCYDRQSGEMRVIKEYVYAMPKLSLSGDYLAFLQQAGDQVDRLYIYQLQTGEAVTPKVFEGSAAAVGGVYLDGTSLIYAVPYYEDEVLMSRVSVLDLLTGQEQEYDWGRLVYSPVKYGNHIAFLSAASGVADDIYLSENGAQPQLLVSDVINMRMGEGFLAYTKEDAVYAYVFETGKHYRLNTPVSKGLLASVCGRSVCWYDVTSYDDVDIVKYADMEW